MLCINTKILNVIIMVVMGIETSCDETAVSIIKKNSSTGYGEIISEVIFSQISQHQPYGGVVPELSSREHIKYLDKICRKAVKKSKLNIEEINAFAATSGPGLLGGLMVGMNYAKALSLSLNKPFFAVNHLQAHILVSRMQKKISFPFLVLLISGGHTQLLISEAYNKFKLLGESIDDAVGEAFDKTAKLLNLKYPGGPEIEKLAKRSKLRNCFVLPKPLIHKNNFNFSFSGLKTSVRKIIENSNLPLKKREAIAYDFQSAILECLLIKCKKAIKFFKKNYQGKDFILSGGVASNLFIREGFKKLTDETKMSFFVPESKLCLDNGTMIAWAGIEKLSNGEKGDDICLLPKPRWSLEDLKSNE